jgi:hypothetical protein
MVIVRRDDPAPSLRPHAGQRSIPDGISLLQLLQRVLVGALWMTEGMKATFFYFTKN